MLQKAVEFLVFQVQTINKGRYNQTLVAKTNSSFNSCKERIKEYSHQCFVKQNEQKSLCFE